MISIIVPIYNAEQYLCRCVDSILSQSYEDFELLLIDDGSVDNSGVLCDEYAVNDSRVRVFHKKNGGVSSARNIGLMHARGEYITFCDSDDYVDSTWLMAYNKFLNYNCDIYIQGVVKIGVNITKNEILPIPYMGRLDKDIVTSLFEYGLFGYVWNKLFSKRIIDHYSLNFDEQSACAEDTQFVAKYIEFASTCICIDESHYCYFLPESNKLCNGNYYNSFIPIAKSLDNVFNYQLPNIISRMLYPNIKDHLINEIVLGRRIDEYCIDLYSRLMQVGEQDKGGKRKILNYLILNTNRLCGVPNYIIKFFKKFNVR